MGAPPPVRGGLSFSLRGHPVWLMKKKRPFATPFLNPQRGGGRKHGAQNPNSQWRGFPPPPCEKWRIREGPPLQKGLGIGLNGGKFFSRPQVQRRPLKSLRECPMRKIFPQRRSWIPPKFPSHSKPSTGLPP